MHAPFLFLTKVKSATMIDKVMFGCKIIFIYLSKDKKTKEAKPEKTKTEKSKEKPKIEKVISSNATDPEEPVEDDAGYLVPAELLKAQRENSVEDKGGEGKERSSIGISLGKYYIILN